MNHPWASRSTTDSGTPSARAYATQQDVVQENNQMTEEEKEQPYRDETLMLDQFEQALSAIPAEDKEAYLQVCKIAPHLIETESNPVLFLRREEYNLQAAAKRLVAYWTFRKNIFGERAFLPVMDLSGNGALCPDALELLQSGIHVVLPNDRQGRSVLCFDREQGEGSPSLLHIDSEGSIPLLLQIVFFTMSVISQNLKSQTEGFVFLVRMRKRAQGAQIKRGIPNHMNFRRLSRAVDVALPIRLHSMHIASCVPASSTFTKTIILAMIQRISALGFALTRSPVLHFDASTDKICQRLQSHELLQEGVPVALGGSWTYDDFFRLLDQWRSLGSDQKLPASEAAGSSSSTAQVIEGKSAMAIDPTAPFQPLDVLGTAALMAKRDCSATTGIQQETLRTIPEELKTTHLKRAPDSKRSATTSADYAEHVSIPSPQPARGVGEEPCHKIMMDQLEETYCIIPAQDKEAYMQARQIAPHLVEAESNPVWFLRREGFNLWAAAHRLVTYWTERKKIFGERAFLPVMDLSGNGALNPDAVALLRTGVCVVLPNDRQGRSVIYLDRERCGEQTPLLLQIGFFSLTVVAQSEKAQVDGFVMLARFREKATGRVPARAQFNRFADLISTAFPVRMHSLHIAACVPSSYSFRLVQATCLKLLQHLRSSFLASARFHIDDSEEKICQRLQACDFAPEGLPVKLGGVWTYDRFTLSLSQLNQQENDQKLPATLAAVKTGCNVHAPGPASRLSQPPSILGAATEMASDTSDEDENTTDEHQQERRQITVGDGEDYFQYVETVVMQQEGRLKLAEALKTIHDKEKTAYLEGVRRVPNLVENESSPIRFLRCDRYDPWAAARRLTTYWKLRLEFFGDRAFLPLNQTGQGALSPEDLEVLNSGYAFVLPNDKYGRSVLGVDRSRLTPSALNNTMARLRCMFYLLCILAENERTQRDGCVVINIVGKANYDRDFTVVKACERLIWDALPVCIHKIHLVSDPTKIGSSSVFKSIVASTFKMLTKVVTPWATVHHSGSEQELIKKLKGYGLTKRGLPVSIGGSWDLENFHNWHKRRKRYEENLILNEGEKLDRKRKVNAVHSRQKRERRKIEKNVLQEQCEEIMAENAILLENNKQLEELLETAMNEVAFVERFETTKVNNAVFVEQMRDGPNSAMLQAHFAGSSSGDSMLPQVECGLRATLETRDLSRRVVSERDLPVPLDEALQIEFRNRFYDLSRRLGTERDLPGPLDEALQNELRNRVNGSFLHAPPSRMSQTTQSMDLGLPTPFYEQSAVSMFGQQQHIPSYSTASSGGAVWLQRLDIAPASPVVPQLQQNLNSWGFLSSPWFLSSETREEGKDDRRGF